jgi:hypothetical protein
MKMNFVFDVLDINYGYLCVLDINYDHDVYIYEMKLALCLNGDKRVHNSLY